MLILYNPPSSARRKPVMPLALLALGALLEGRHPYTIIDGNLDRQPLETIDRLVRDRGARTLGITVMPGPQLAAAVPLSRELKARHPGLTIVWGGYFPTQHYDVCLRSGYVDYVVRGHGEVVFQSLVDLLAQGEDPTGLPGLAYRRQDGMVVTNAMAPIPHPDTLPEFPYHASDVDRFPLGEGAGRHILVTMWHHPWIDAPGLVIWPRRSWVHRSILLI